MGERGCRKGYLFLSPAKDGARKICDSATKSLFPPSAPRPSRRACVWACSTKWGSAHAGHACSRLDIKSSLAAAAIERVSERIHGLICVIAVIALSCNFHQRDRKTRLRVRRRTLQVTQFGTSPPPLTPLNGHGRKKERRRANNGAGGRRRSSEVILVIFATFEREDSEEESTLATGRRNSA